MLLYLVVGFDLTTKKRLLGVSRELVTIKIIKRPNSWCARNLLAQIPLSAIEFYLKIMAALFSSIIEEVALNRFNLLVISLKIRYMKPGDKSIKIQAQLLLISLSSTMKLLFNEHLTIMKGFTVSCLRMINVVADS